MAPGTLSAALVDELARLHVACLPESLFSRLGMGATRCLYRFMAASRAESFAVAFDADGVPVGASVTIFQPTSLLRRAVLGSNLGFWLLRKAHRLPWASVADSKSPGLRPMPELMFLFVSPALRSCGAGRTLVTLAQSEVYRLGGAELCVMTEDRPGNRALDFYRGMGYELQGAARKFGKAFVVFTRSLP